MDELLRDTYLEVDLDKIGHNMRTIRAMVGEDVAIAAVVKANAYGLGLMGIAQEIMGNGGDYLAVATLTEALEIRRSFKDYKILVMGFTPNRFLDHVVKNHISQTIFSYDQAKLLNDLGLEYGIRPRVHIKYDTGFNRLGFKDGDASLDEIGRIFSLDNLEVEGIFSHLSLLNRASDEIQYNKFTRAIEKLEKRGLYFKYKHIADGITAVDNPDFSLNMIRPGSIIYGIKSFHCGSLDIELAFKFKTRVYNVRKISKGEGVGYDYSWRAERDSIIGTLPFGYSDGYPRNLMDKGFVSIRGQKAPLIGIICMDQTMVDLTHIENVENEDEVIIYGDGSDKAMDIYTAGDLGQTNKNEIISRIGMRVPRVYTRGGRIVNIINYI